MKIKNTTITAERVAPAAADVDVVVREIDRESGGAQPFTVLARPDGRYVFEISVSRMDAARGEEKVRLSCRQVLREAQRLKARSLALPALGRGLRDIPVKATAKIMAQEVFRHIFEDNGDLERILFCLDDEASVGEFEKNALGYLDYIVNKLKSPFLTVDAIIEVSCPSGQPGIVLIQRSNPPYGWALPGGFVDYGESLERAAVREAKEETGLDVGGIRQFHTYSAPGRDPRFHTVNTVFIGQARGVPHAGDDAAAAQVVALADLAGIDYAFDHGNILQDYLRFKQGHDPFSQENTGANPF